jgi:hypothetical protein
MSLVKCPSGHVYNPIRYGKICPYCKMKLEEEEGIRKPEGFEPPVELLQEDIKPVCGWLVCISGARVGMEYRIHSGKNFIGRGDDMDIQILGDNEINRKNHAIIVYDPKNRKTMLLPGDSEGLVYLSEEAIYLPTEVKSYNTIELGRSRFLFISLCGENFEWNNLI